MRERSSLALGRHLLARHVERSDHRQIGRRREEHLEHGLEPVERNAVADLVEHRALRKGRQHLVGRVDAEIGPRLRRREWQARVELKMRPPGLVHQQHLAGGVNDPLDGRQVGAHAVVRRRNEVDGGEIGMLLERARDGLGCNAMVHVQFFVHDRLHVDRLGAAHHQAAQHGFVRIARYRDLVARIERRHHHALVAAGGSIDQKERIVGAVRFGRELLRFLNGFERLQQVVDAGHRR